MHGTSHSPAKVADLTMRPDFRLGSALVSPGIRRLSGPGGTATIEPRVMHVLLALADSGGAVVSREALMQRCWGGQFVGDDALNRAIAEVRRAARAEAAGSFSVETIPRIGYRLIGATPEPVAEVSTSRSRVATSTSTLSRRALVAGAGGIIAIGGVAAAWRALPGGDDARVAALIAQGEQAMRQSLPESDAQGVGFLREAVALAPDSAVAWSRLALALETALDHAMPAAAAATASDAETAARRALALDPRQPDALAALALLPPMFGDWLAAEQRLRAVLAIAPNNLAALSGLGVLMASVGRNREAAAIGARIVEREPLSPGYQYRRAYGQWNMGRAGDAERTLDRALELWPRHPAVWNTRLVLFAFTGRASSALAMLADDAALPPMLPPDHLDRLRAALLALDRRAPTDVARAVALWRSAAPGGPSPATNATMYLAKLGALDDSFAVAEGYLLRRGPFAVRLERTFEQPSINDQRHRKTMMLFLGALPELRADPRFLPLCAEIGLIDYWRRAGVWADFLVT